jgi:hypothetical protein
VNSSNAQRPGSRKSPTCPLDFVLPESEYRFENLIIEHRPFDPFDIVPPTRFVQIFFGQNLGCVNDLAHMRNGGTLDRQVWRQLAGIVDVLQMDANGVIQSGMSCDWLGVCDYNPRSARFFAVNSSSEMIPSAFRAARLRSSFSSDDPPTGAGVAEGAAGGASLPAGHRADPKNLRWRLHLRGREACETPLLALPDACA